MANRKNALFEGVIRTVSRGSTSLEKLNVNKTRKKKRNKKQPVS